MTESEIDQTLSWLPEQSQEDGLHATRLLSVEERPFQRVTKSLLSKDSLLRPSTSHLPSPPPEGEVETDLSVYENQLQRFREDVLLDYAALENSIVRIQLVRSSNERERERYATEKAKILRAAEAVRQNTLTLRAELAETQRVLALRRFYDELAAKILDDRALKSREECSAEIEQLEKELEDLEQENVDVEFTWATRKEQFERVAAEGEAMMRLIKDIKEEPEAEKDDASDGDDEGNQEGDRSPRPADADDSTPMIDGGEQGGLTASHAHSRLASEEVTQANSQAATPNVQSSDAHEDVTMADSTETVAKSTNVDDVAQPSAKVEVNDTMDET